VIRGERESSGELRVRAGVPWRVASIVCLGAYLVAAALNMTHTAAGFATNHLADIAGPAWLYIISRGLGAPHRHTRIRRLVGATAERAAAILFLASTATEISQRFWPSGPFPGRFDPFDIGAFALGIMPLYLLDRWSGAAGTPIPPVGPPCQDRGQ
jgi:hypothetical protein